MKKAFYTIEEFSKEFCVGKTKIYSLLNSGEITAKKIGRRTVIPAESVKRWEKTLVDYVRPPFRTVKPRRSS